ncbi:MAG: serine hydrolase domain-containing protein [Mangrovibacterium sp.]
MSKVARVILLLIVLLMIHSHKITQIETPKYGIESKGLNEIIYNDLSNFENSNYIEHEVNSFLKKWNLKGVSIAIVKEEKLVYAHGFGIATREGNAVQPYHVFRVASISKLITAIGIMHLIEEKKINLNDKVFGPNAILDNVLFENVNDKRIYNITIRDLLAHSAGWTQRTGDPAFSALSIAEFVGDEAPVTMYSYYKYITNKRLNYTPGRHYSYSNMGYMFLTDVISKVSNSSYEDYIQDNILIPNGIFDMHIGSSFQKDKRSNEVNYWVGEADSVAPCLDGSERLVPKADGGNNIELLGAAGGWICSSVELAKLVTLVDGQTFIPDILTRQSIREMTCNVTTKGPLGWRSVYSNGSWIRTGSMAGTIAEIKRMDDGLTWIFLSNTSNWKGNKLERNIDYLMSTIIQRIEEWPDHDLFNLCNVPNSSQI